MANPRILVVFDGRENGLIDQMARKVAEGARKAGAEVLMLTAANAKPDDVPPCDALIIGTPCHFAGPSAAIKRFMDATWGIRGKLSGKVGAAFTASEHLAGGHEMTLLSCLTFFMSHGMIIQGNCEGDTFGAVVIAPEGDKDEIMADQPDECRGLGAQVAELLKRLKHA